MFKAQQRGPVFDLGVLLCYRYPQLWQIRMVGCTSDKLSSGSALVFCALQHGEEATVCNPLCCACTALHYPQYALHLEQRDRAHSDVLSATQQQQQQHVCSIL
jgi:hypothetical protein